MAVGIWKSENGKGIMELRARKRAGESMWVMMND
jgi:hypothetical protein